VPSGSLLPPAQSLLQQRLQQLRQGRPDLRRPDLRRHADLRSQGPQLRLRQWLRPLPPGSLLP
jgi:hypothetical protein